jgi:hypothetical protein
MHFVKNSGEEAQISPLFLLCFFSVSHLFDFDNHQLRHVGGQTPGSR